MRWRFCAPTNVSTSRPYAPSSYWRGGNDMANQLSGRVPIWILDARWLVTIRRSRDGRCIGKAWYGRATRLLVASAADQEIPYMASRIPGDDGLADPPSPGTSPRRARAKGRGHRNEAPCKPTVECRRRRRQHRHRRCEGRRRGVGHLSVMAACMMDAWREETPDEKEARPWLAARAHRRTSGPTSSKGEGRTRENWGGGRKNVG